MALNEPRAWLVAYDVANRRRLARLHRFLKRKAVPVQYSVFVFVGSAVQLGRLVQDIEDYIDPAADDVRVYQIPRSIEFDVRGRGSFPQGAQLTSARQERLPEMLWARQSCYDGVGATPSLISLPEEG